MKIKYIISLLLIAISSPLFGQTEQPDSSIFRAPNPYVWYRLLTRYNGTDSRRGQCMQVSPPGTAHADTLWMADPLPTSNPLSDWQFFRFVPMTTNPVRYEIICKAAPNGYLNPDPTAFSPAGRWVYVMGDSAAMATDAEKTGFYFADNDSVAGIDAETGYVYCAITTDRVKNSIWDYMNAGSAKQGYAVNMWYKAYSENANEWSFAFEPHQAAPASLSVPSVDQEGSSAPQTAYDLLGRPVEHPSHGIYIIGRKLVLIP